MSPDVVENISESVENGFLAFFELQIMNHFQTVGSEHFVSVVVVHFEQLILAVVVNSDRSEFLLVFGKIGEGKSIDRFAQMRVLIILSALIC